MAGKAGREGVISNAPGLFLSLLLLISVLPSTVVMEWEPNGNLEVRRYAVPFLPCSVAAFDRTVTSLLDRFEKSLRSNAVRVSAAKFPKLR